MDNKRAYLRVSKPMLHLNKYNMYITRFNNKQIRSKNPNKQYKHPLTDMTDTYQICNMT